MFLSERGQRVVEVERPMRKGSRAARLKSDPLDAERAAHHVLSGGGATPRLAADTQALRVLVTTRRLSDFLCKRVRVVGLRSGF